MKDPGAGKKRLIIGYVRVSTGKQELSVDTQETRIRANAVSTGGQIDEVIVDRESAKDLNREGVKRLLDMVDRRQVERIIIWKLDRLTRSVRDLASLLDTFDKRDVALVSLNETLDTSNVTGRMVVKMTTLFSEWERLMIGERTMTALEHKRARGERMGNVPYGYKAGLNKRGADGRTTVAAKLEPEESEQKVVEQMLNWRRDGYGLQEIVDKLESARIMTRSGSSWRVQYVSSVLAQARKRGEAE